ncbi:MAG: GNAT family N-acetyltransferase [Burkholderiaceae bacterium]
MTRSREDTDYCMRLVSDLSEVEPSAWNALLPESPGAVFMRHEWLAALESTGCVGEGSGWQPLHMLLETAQGRLVGAAPLYAKSHSYGEYVFDWAWADAYRRHGLAYYPKLLSAVPFTPVAGPRLLAADDRIRTLLARLLAEQAERANLSSLHVLFPDDDGRRALEAAGFMIRLGVQFHWRNDDYPDFEAFLASLSQPKRKKIRAERRKVAEAGVRCERRVGTEITPEDWRFFIGCYDTTYAEHHSTPYLNLAFFEAVSRAMPQAFVLNIARVDGEPVACSLLVRDGDRLFGRYWGARRFIPHLHFELAYYQSIEAAIALGATVIEGGAQGEHKMARGFLPVQTCSAHRLTEPAFADAVDRYLERERGMIDGYLDELNERAPFRRAGGGAIAAQTGTASQPRTPT